MMGSACVTLALASRGLTNIAPIGSIHIHPPAFPTKFVWSALQSLAFGQLSSVAALTQATAAWLRANTRARRIDVIPNPILWPVPESDPGIEPSTVCKPDRKMLLAAGRLDPQKGFDLLIPAFAGLADKNPDWDLVILGEGAGRERLQAEISARGLESRVFLPGWAGNVAAWYARAQLYVMSSRFEGFPLTLAEAMAHGLPAISFDCDTGPRDIIRSGVDGFLIPPENVPALTEGLDRLMGDDGLRSTIASAAKQARDRFSMESVARMWENMFDEFLSPKVGQQA
jgi:glycosyltransferase involved in cell wall biosynthesis